MREYISPNWHAVLIHAPLGLLSVGIVLELMGFLWRRSGLRPAARWMILIGAVTCVPALTSGIYAYRDVISPNTSGDITFQDNWDTLNSKTDGLLDGVVKDRTGTLKDHPKEIVDVSVRDWLASRPGQLLRNHIIFNVTGVSLVFLVVILWIACSDAWRRRLYLPLLLLLILGKGALIYGSHDAGQAVYVHAVAVEPATPPPLMALTRQEQLKQALPPAQLHFTMAGWVIAISLVALALSIRAISQPEMSVMDETWFQTPETNGDEGSLPAPAGAAVGIETATAATSGSIFDPVADDPTTVPLAEQRRVVVRSTAPGASRVVIAPATPAVRLPNSRFWMLATALGLVTIASGLWIIGFWTLSNKWHDLRETLSGERRNLYHSIIGSSIVVLTLVLAIVTRFARRNKVLLSIFSTLLFLCIAAQVWLGILLTFDGPKGPLNRYNAPEPKKAAMMTPALGV